MAIDNSVRSLPWMFAAVTPSNVSAQSPPCRMNASPAATLAILVRNSSHSPAKTNGGNRLSAADHPIDRVGVGVGRLLQRAQGVQFGQRRHAGPVNSSACGPRTGVAMDTSPSLIGVRDPARGVFRA